MTFKFIPIWYIFQFLRPEKVLHNVVNPWELLFDPLFAKFSQENKKNYENAVYIEKT